MDETEDKDNEVEITEESALLDIPPDDADEVPAAVQETFDWNTSLISQFCRDGDIDRLRLFVEFSQQSRMCGEYASEMADRLDLETGLSPLHHAARYQQLDLCLMLISNLNFVFGVNIKDANEQTPLHSAFRSSSAASTQQRQMRTETDFGNQIQDAASWQEEYATTILSSDHPLVYLFAKANGDINAQDKYLLTPLHYAVARNNLAGVKQLIALKADIESADRQGIRPLHLAFREGYLAIAEYLIEHGAEIDELDGDDWTPLHHACAKGRLDVVRFMKMNAPKTFAELLPTKTNTEATCLHLAVQCGDVELVEFILDQFTEETLRRLINEQVEPLGTPLHISAKYCDPAMVNLLYERGADPLIVNADGQSALHVASASNRQSMVQALLSLTQSILLEIKDDRGRTALSVTTDPEIIEQLMAAGADVSSLDANNMNVLMIAVSHSHTHIVDCLLSRFSDQLIPIVDQVEVKDERSVFLIAVQTGHVKICSRLLEHSSIRWDTVDKQLLNAIHLAARYDHEELIRWLCNDVRRPDRFLSITSHRYSVETTPSSDLLTVPSASPILRSYIDAQNEDGKTPLHIASERGHTQCIKVLLRLGAGVLITNHLGQLPLHAAIQHGHGSSVKLLLDACERDMAEFHSVLSRRQSPLITACQNGFADIVKLLLSEDIGTRHGISADDAEQYNPLEIAIQGRRIETTHALLEHPHTEQWLMPVRRTHRYDHETPLREMIRYMPECARHAFDKLILKTSEVDAFGDPFERTVYRYKHIDDYFTSDGTPYTTRSSELYRNHPFIIALDRGHHFLLEHPLAKQLMLRKWKLYRPLFYFPRMLSFLLLFILTLYALFAPAPNAKVSASPSTDFLSTVFVRAALPLRWGIAILSGMNLLKILVEILLYRGLRVPFAQLFGIMSYTISIVAFLPDGNGTNQILSWQWQLASFAILFQWFNTAVVLRSMPVVGTFIVLIESILIHVTSLILIMLPLLIAFTLSTQMIFFNQPSFETLLHAMHKSSVMLIGELDYETLFYSKPTFTVAKIIFIPFLIVMTIVFMNLLLGITVGDIKGSMETARAKANAYWIRELIYIEANLPSRGWLQSNVIEDEHVDHYARDSGAQNESDAHKMDDKASLESHPHAVELRKLSDILDMLCSQAKQALEKEIDLEQMLRQLLSTR